MPTPDNKRILSEKCPQCGGQSFLVPEYICDKCHWQDPTRIPPDPFTEKTLKKFEEKYPRLGDDWDPLLRFYRIDLPEGDTRSIKVFISAALNAQREETTRNIQEDLDELAIQIKQEIREKVEEMIENMPSLNYEENDYNAGKMHALVKVLGLLSPNNKT